jgi:hypothetical protein
MVMIMMVMMIMMTMMLVGYGCLLIRHAITAYIHCFVHQFCSFVVIDQF